MQTESTYTLNQIQIRYVRIPQDEKNEKMQCSCCGAELRKAMVINGQIFGYDCGAKKAGMGKFFKNDFHRRVRSGLLKV